MKFTKKHQRILYSLLAIIGIVLIHQCFVGSIEGYNDNQLQYIHETLLRILERSISIFEKHQLIYWADGGTLLGCIREGKIIDWDDDIDLAMTKEDYNRLRTNTAIHDDLDAVGLKLIGGDRADYGLLKIVMKQPDNDYTKNKIFIDIMCYHRDKDKYIMSCPAERSYWPKIVLQYP